MAKQAEVTILGIYLEETFDLKGLRGIGLFQTKDPAAPAYAKGLKDYPAIAARIQFYFGLKRIYDYSLLEPFGPGIPAENELPRDVVTPGEWLLQESRLVNLIANN